MSDLSTIIKQLERERDHLQSQIAKLGNAMALFSGPRGKTSAVRKVRKLTGSARARIRAAQKARWAKWRKEHKKR
jgi:hypothetical protein